MALIGPQGVPGRGGLLAGRRAQMIGNQNMPRPPVNIDGLPGGSPGGPPVSMTGNGLGPAPAPPVPPPPNPMWSQGGPSLGQAPMGGFPNMGAPNMGAAPNAGMSRFGGGAPPTPPAPNAGGDMAGGGFYGGSPATNPNLKPMGEPEQSPWDQLRSFISARFQMPKIPFVS